VEGDNADLRHYLARLGRKSRCFSRSLVALARQVKLFVFCYNARQLFVTLGSCSCGVSRNSTLT